ncbi:creatininase family protein [bacterium]|nr:creatininase family protein [bacterium]
MKAQRKSNPLDQLIVIERLEVGPVQLTANRLVAPYKVTTKKGTSSFDFTYKYEEPVFDLSNPQSINLAAVIAAQIALNYGLFCKQIIFHDYLDEKDRAFLVEMAENTAREIYVKKFLEPNPFITGKAANLPVIAKKTYVQAELLFPNLQKSAPAVSMKSPEAKHYHRERHAILSSGGKDSLLTYGLLHEMRQEVHPIFINESGRHWFTALNAYRYFSKNVPNTSRVWTNSDRLFSWMLRHLPFVRPDFSDMRSDEYPIQLWTIAVFLFGSLPLVQKRGIGRLMLGDEFDTTEKRTFKGITHYSGLFDQSRYFDEAMTRYFQKKGWMFSQFSILRPLSEILIQKILAVRYPALMQHQMSCHASHKEKDIIHPCGRCEKCRRIVGMLVALGEDPQACGYSTAQIEACLRALAEKGVFQETASTEHLDYTLGSMKRITLSESRKRRAKAHPELMKLRFDRERSPMNAIPVDLRRPLYQILLDCADGAVKRTGRVWLDIDLLEHAEIQTPYRFETPSPHDVSSKVSHLAEKFLLRELTWPEAQEKFKQVDVALLPAGSIEQHGPHLPLDTDAFDADYLAKQVASACSEPKPIVLPCVTYGVSYAHEDFSGTISISPNTLAQLTYEIGMSIAKQGITKLVIINGHGGNSPALHFAAQMINRDAHIFVCVDTGETSDTDVEAMSQVPNDVHAGDIETSTTLAVRPQLVQMNLAEKFVPKFSSRFLDFTSKRSVEWYARTAKISASGVFGDPTKATKEKGERIWAVMIKHLVELVESVKGMTLDEIHQKRL